MKKVAIMGAGYVVKPMVDYFIDTCNYHVTIATRTVSKAEKMIAGRAMGKAMSWTTDQLDILDNLVNEVDIVVMMVPFGWSIIAKSCLKYGKPMLTTEYMHDEILLLDAEARKNHTLILTELGEDPGLDVMGAKQLIDGIKSDGGHVISLTSYGAGLPSYEDNRNPFGYKFSWGPHGVLGSLAFSSAYLEKGKKIVVPAKLDNHRLVDVYGIGTFETYPNNDAARYISHFGLDENVSSYRGLLRFIGWCNTFKAFLKLKLIEGTREARFEGKTYAQYMAELVEELSTDNLMAKVANFLNINVDDDIIKRLDWLGLFAEVPIPLKKGTNSELLADLMIKKMSYGENEKDMIIVHNEVVAEFPDRKEKRISSMLVEGIPGGDSAMARSVALPAAIAGKLILEGQIVAEGVQMPTSVEMYKPILEEMETFGFTFKKTTLLL